MTKRYRNDRLEQYVGKTIRSISTNRAVNEITLTFTDKTSLELKLDPPEPPRFRIINIYPANFQHGVLRG